MEERTINRGKPGGEGKGIKNAQTPPFFGHTILIERAAGETR